jgi:hypothetical protein
MCGLIFVGEDCNLSLKSDLAVEDKYLSGGKNTMTVGTFVGLMCISFGVPFAVFALVLARKAQLVIISLVGYDVFPFCCLRL